MIATVEKYPEARYVRWGPGRYIQVDSPTLAAQIAEAINLAYQQGQQQVRTAMRDALGLDD